MQTEWASAFEWMSPTDKRLYLTEHTARWTGGRISQRHIYTLWAWLNLHGFTPTIKQSPYEKDWSGSPRLYLYWNSQSGVPKSLAVDLFYDNKVLVVC